MTRRVRRVLALGLGCLVLGPLAPLVARADVDVVRPDVGAPEVRPGRVISWGGPEDQQDVLTPPADLVDAVAVAASATRGGYSNLALRADGTVVGWGLDAHGEADPPAGLADVVGIDLGAGFGVALRADGTVAAWGSDESGQLDVPADLGEVVAVSAGGYLGYRGVDLPDAVCGYGLAVLADGTVARWGADTPDLACDLLDERLDPPADLTDVVAVSAGARSAVALRADGTVVAWGSGVGAGLDGTPPGSWSDVVAVSAGDGHLLGLRADGTVLAYGIWGESGPPQQTDVTALSAGGDLDLFLQADGDVSVHRGEPPPDGATGAHVAISAGSDYGLAVVAEGDDPAGPLLGSREIQPHVDENPAGTAEAFQYEAERDGAATQLHVYVDEQNEADRLLAGVYTDEAGEPGRLIAVGRTDELSAGQWNVITLPSLEVVRGQRYWLALLGPRESGVLRFRDLPDGEGGPTRTSERQDLSGGCGLPRTWQSGRDYANAPASVYLS